MNFGDQQSLDEYLEQLGYLEGMFFSVVFDSCIYVFGDFSTDLQ